MEYWYFYETVDGKHPKVQYLSKRQQGLRCPGLSLSLFSVWLVLSVPVFSQEFLSVIKDDSNGRLMWAYKLLIPLTVCLLIL